MQPAKPKTTDPNELGKVAFAKNDFETAIQHFTNAIDQKLKLDVAYSNRSACYIALSKSYDAGGSMQILENAVKDADAAIKANKKFVKAYVRKGTALLQLKKYAEAKKAFEDGLKVDPTDKGLHDGLAAAAKLTANAKRNKKQAQDPVKSEDVVVGIDLGTTYSCISYWHNGSVVVIPNDRGDMTTPSYVSFNEKGGRAVGMAAKLDAPRNPVNTIFDVKRFIGSQFSDDGVQTDISRYPYNVVKAGDDDKPLISVTQGKDTTTYAPEEISAMVLGYLKRQAETYLKGPVKKAVITVPAYFNDSQRAATKTAGEIAGLEVLRIINEPTAAALAYGLDRKSMNASTEATTVLIFDLGGGTFDVSVLTIDNGVFQVRATGGDTRLGGEDIDRCVADVIWKFCADKGFPNLQTEPRAIKRVMHAVEKAKRELSSVETADIVVEGLVAPTDGSKGFDLEYTLTREEFERVTKSLVQRTIDTVKKVLKDAAMEPSQIQDIVLVGGSTRIPKIQSELIAHFGGKQLCKTLNPDEAVAYGAAVQGAILSGTRSAETSNLLLLDVTPLSLGIETVGRVMSVVIPRNTSIPCQRTEVYTTESDYQTEVDISVFEGERHKTTDNHALGEFQITGIERAKRGEPQIDVTFGIDSNGMLTVSAKDRRSGAEADIQIQRGSRASDQQIAQMKENAEKYRRQDEDFQRTQKLRNDLESRLYDLGQYIESMGDNSEAVKKVAEKKFQDTSVWFESNGENASADQLAKKVGELALLMRKLRV